MPLNAQAVTPPTLNVSAEDGSSPGAPTRDLPANVPRTPDNLVAGKMPAVAQAGVDLATIGSIHCHWSDRHVDAVSGVDGAEYCRQRIRCVQAST